MAAKSKSIKQFRCEKCNAPYPLGADDVIATCPYCGYTFTVGGSEINHLLIPNKLDTKSVKAAVKKWLKFVAKKTVGRVTATSTVLAIIKRRKKGVGTAALMEKTGFDQKKVANIVFKLRKEGIIKSAGRGVYLKV